MAELIVTEQGIALMEIAKMVASMSRDKSTQVGCVFVNDAGHIISSGYNGFPHGVAETIEQRHLRPEKYEWTVHAETNGLANAARMGISTRFSTVYTTQIPCSNCMAQLIQAGVSTVVCPDPAHLERQWAKTQIAIQMAKEAFLTIVWYK